MKLNKKGGALGTGEKQAEAELRNKTQSHYPGALSGWLGSASEALQGQVLFSVFINGTDEGLEMCLKICG